MEASIQRSSFTLISTRIALRALDLVRASVLLCGRGLSYVGRATLPLWNGFRSLVIIPFYRLVFFADLRLRKTVASTRGIFFLFFTSKYTLHLLLAVVAVPLTLIHFQSASAAVDVGQRSILYALVTNGEESVTQEGLTSATESPTQYLADSLREEPGIDFGIESDDEYAFANDQGIAGVIAYQPLPPHDQAVSPQPPASTVAIEVPPEPPAPVETPAERGIQTYSVRSGDTIATIARRYGVSQDTILWANNLTSRSTLKVGQKLEILPVSGVAHTVKRGETLAQIATRYGVKTSDIASVNALGKTLAVGTDIVIPNGRPLPATTVAAKPTSPSPVATAKPAAEAPAPAPARTKTPKVVGRVSVKPDVPIAKIRNKAFDIYQELSNSKEDTRAVPEDKEESEAKKKTKLLWPTRLAIVNQYYGWNHTGLDIDGDYTDPIYASEDGTVTTAGWNSGGYGLQIVIDHPGGLRTRYAHASKLFVKAGDEVKRGQVIGYVGTTGRSTGTHLHYEVYDNGKRKNPLAYTR